MAAIDPRRLHAAHAGGAGPGGAGRHLGRLPSGTDLAADRPARGERSAPELSVRPDRRHGSLPAWAGAAGLVLRRHVHRHRPPGRGERGRSPARRRRLVRADRRAPGVRRRGLGDRQHPAGRVPAAVQPLRLSRRAQCGDSGGLDGAARSAGVHPRRTGLHHQRRRRRRHRPIPPGGFHSPRLSRRRDSGHRQSRSARPAARRQDDGAQPSRRADPFGLGQGLPACCDLEISPIARCSGPARRSARGAATSRN